MLKCCDLCVCKLFLDWYCYSLECVLGVCCVMGKGMDESMGRKHVLLTTTQHVVSLQKKLQIVKEENTHLLCNMHAQCKKVYGCKHELDKVILAQAKLHLDNTVLASCICNFFMPSPTVFCLWEYWAFIYLPCELRGLSFFLKVPPSFSISS